MIRDKNGEHIVQHHVKYCELHGVDEVISMTVGEHRALHNKLRREGKCTIPVDELRKISNVARERTDNCKSHRYRYRRRLKTKKQKVAYLKNNTQQIHFSETIDNSIRLWEQIRYFINTGSINYSSGFRGNNGKKPFIVEIE